MLASTVQFSRCGRSRSRTRRRPPSGCPVRRGTTRDRSSRAETPSGQRRPAFACGLSGRSCEIRRSVPSGPNSVPDFRARRPVPYLRAGSTRDVATRRSNSQCSTRELDAGRAGRVADCDRLRRELLRKEVIQPHLPVRLPCYDFVPIADPTFDSSLPKGLGHWLRVLPTFVT